MLFCFTSRVSSPSPLFMYTYCYSCCGYSRFKQDRLVLIWDYSFDMRNIFCHAMRDRCWKRRNDMRKYIYFPYKYNLYKSNLIWYHYSIMNDITWMHIYIYNHLNAWIGTSEQLLRSSGHFHYQYHYYYIFIEVFHNFKRQIEKFTQYTIVP